MFLALLASHSVSFNEKHDIRKGGKADKENRDYTSDKDGQQLLTSLGRRGYIVCVCSSLFLGVKQPLAHL